MTCSPAHLVPLLSVPPSLPRASPCLSIHAMSLNAGASGSLADVTFVVEGRAVRLHRAILSARCDYFRSESDMHTLVWLSHWPRGWVAIGSMNAPSRGREGTLCGRFGLALTLTCPPPPTSSPPNTHPTCNSPYLYLVLMICCVPFCVAFLCCHSVPGMFAHGFNESKAGTINLVDMSYPVFVALVRFLYTDNIPPPSVEAIVLPLLQQVMIRPAPIIQPVHLSRVLCRSAPSVSPVPHQSVVLAEPLNE